MISKNMLMGNIETQPYQLHLTTRYVQIEAQSCAKIYITNIILQFYSYSGLCTTVLHDARYFQNLIKFSF